MRKRKKRGHVNALSARQNAKRRRPLFSRLAWALRQRIARTAAGKQEQIVGDAGAVAQPSILVVEYFLDLVERTGRFPTEGLDGVKIDRLLLVVAKNSGHVVSLRVSGVAETHLNVTAARNGPLAGIARAGPFTFNVIAI